MLYKVIERFVSIDGEGPSAGELAVFIRFYGCNLNCAWCDTKYSFDKNESYENTSKEEIIDYIKRSRAANVTLTGGEPLLVPDIIPLLEALNDCPGLNVHIETNGSVDIGDIKKKNYRNISFVIDYKLPLSGMENLMLIQNLSLVTRGDVYKFVIAGKEDLLKACNLIETHCLTEKCSVHLSPVLGLINPAEIVDFMKEKSLTGVKLQLQLHKLIWPDITRGV